MPTPKCSACGQRARVVGVYSVGSGSVNGAVVCTNCGHATCGTCLQTVTFGVAHVCNPVVVSGSIHVAPFLHAQFTAPAWTSSAHYPTTDPLDVDRSSIQDLVAAILNSEDECLIYTDAQLEESVLYEIVQKRLPDERATILTVKRR